MKASCACGEVTLDIARAPTVRMFCHCTVCQRANRAPFGDITLLRPKYVTVHGEVNYRRMKLFPVSVRRGFCAACDDLIVEHLWPAPVGITFVPSNRYEDPSALPEALGHIFYDTRVEAIDDALPKYEGFIPSQMATGRWMLPVYRT